jgi:hypothetical protein
MLLLAGRRGAKSDAEGQLCRRSGGNHLPESTAAASSSRSARTARNIGSML